MSREIVNGSQHFSGPPFLAGEEVRRSPKRTAAGRIPGISTSPPRQHEVGAD
jgi:hypothetical protein